MGQIGMQPVPDTTHIAMFFVYSGLGAACEAVFRKITGRRVRGVWGRIWMWSFFLITGRRAAGAWLDAGLGGDWLIPLHWPYRPGPPMVRWLARHVFDVVKA